MKSSFRSQASFNICLPEENLNMKLLNWMHRKFRNNSSEPIKDYSIGHSHCLSGRPSLDDQQFYLKSNYGTKPLRQAQRDHNLRQSFAGLEAARVEEEYFEEESSPAVSDTFHGFLAIGTLGSDTTIAVPPTPTFSISVKNITENETEVTENELKLVEEELEKVLGAEAREEFYNESSGRNSHASTGRSSHGSTITLSGKPLEGTETNGTTVCPLQGYLFGSAIELPETAVTKKEQRTSLGELFQRTKIAEETPCAKYEKRSYKESDKSALNLMKKMLKKKIYHASSRSSAGLNGGTVYSTTTEKKMHKILQMFHKKVHPEGSTTLEKACKTQKNGMKNFSSNRMHDDGDPMVSDEDIIIVPPQTLSKEGRLRYKSQSSPEHFILNGSDSSGNRECWIKSDADYLVLEL